MKVERSEVHLIDKFVLGMVALRFMSGSIEVLAAFIMLRLNQVEKALMVNSALALVGPIVLISTTALGLIGVADKISFNRLIWVICGITFLFIGIFKK